MTATQAARTRKPAQKKAPEKAAQADQKLCRCGCGQQVTNLFKPGHDARLVSNLRKAVEAGNMTPEAAQAEASSVSEALGRKMARSLELLAAAAVKADSGKQDKAA